MAVFEMSYYHTTLTISAACSMYPDYLLYLPESAKHNSSTLKSVQKLCSEWHTIIQLLRFIFKRASELEAGNINYKCYTCICTYTCILQTTAVHLKTLSFVVHKLYFNLYGTFPIKSNDVTFISIALYTLFQRYYIIIFILQ